MSFTIRTTVPVMLEKHNKLKINMEKIVFFFIVFFWKKEGIMCKVKYVQNMFVFADEARSAQ